MPFSVACYGTDSDSNPPDGEDFKFVLKASRQITHMQRLKDAADSVSYLLEAAGTMKELLGPLFFQLPPNLKKDVPRLRDFLALLPPKRRVAFEFRHQSWSDKEVLGLLRDHRAALCIAEAEDNLEVPFERPPIGVICGCGGPAMAMRT